MSKRKQNAPEFNAKVALEALKGIEDLPRRWVRSTRHMAGRCRIPVSAPRRTTKKTRPGLAQRGDACSQALVVAPYRVITVRAA